MGWTMTDPCLALCFQYPIQVQAGNDNARRQLPRDLGVHNPRKRRQHGQFKIGERKCDPICDLLFEMT